MKRSTLVLLCLCLIDQYGLSRLWAAQEFDGRIVFSRKELINGHAIAQIYSIDGKNKEVVQLTKEGFNGWPRWSPDGQKIVFASSRRKEHKNREIYLMDSDGKNQRRLTNTEGGNSSRPRWGSNNNEIYFRSAIKGNIQENIIDLRSGQKWTIKATGSIPDLKSISNIDDYIEELKRMENKELKKAAEEAAKAVKGYQDWSEKMGGMFQIMPSPDGKYHLLYYESKRKIDLVNLSTGKKKELLKDTAIPAWSIDSKSIAVAYTVFGSKFMSLIIYDIERDKYNEYKIGILPNKNEEIDCGGKMSWSLDSKKIVYSCGPPDISTPADELKYWLYILDLETKKSEKLIQGSSPDWY